MTAGIPPPGLQRRQAVMQGAAALLFSGGLGVAGEAAADESEEVDVYFGVGCFWHVQHEFVEAEKRVLGRSDEQLTSLAGYAGGRRVGVDRQRPDRAQGLVCYHNMMGVADYGKLGHGEVVGMRIPVSSYSSFVSTYLSLFDRGGDRPDKGDRGPEYRHLVGMPGGVNSKLFRELEQQAEGRWSLDEGKGDDGDNLGKKGIWVMDSANFPFYRGEVYHQYHDGFMPGEDYPREYNSLAARAVKAGKLDSTGCPDIV